MGLLQTIAQSSSQTPNGLRAVICGQEKIGKTTLACGAPKALLIPLEDGYGGVSVNKTDMPNSYEQVVQLIDEITGYVLQQNFPYKTLVFDSATAFERLLHDYVLRCDPAYVTGNRKALTMEAALGGYGKAYTFANDEFAKFLNKCDILSRNKINIVFTCHVFADKVVDPINGEYDSWDLLLHSPKNQKTYGKREIITQWADVVGFLHEPMFIIEGDNISRGMSSNKGRFMGLSRAPSYVAGNRYGVTGEIPIPPKDGWNFLAKAIYDSRKLDFYNRDV